MAAQPAAWWQSITAMSTKHAPPSSAPGPAARRRKIRPSAPAAKRAKTAPPAPQTWAQRIRRYFPSASAPLLVLALAVVAVCFGTILIAGWRLAYLPASIGQTWLSIHGAPLIIDGVEVTAAPLLPPLAIVALVASRVRAATKHRVSVLDLAAIVALILVTSLTLSGIALFMVTDASNVFAIEPPNAASALLLPLGTHLAGFVFGIKPIVWQALARRAGLPEGVATSALTASHVVRDLLLAALAVYLLLLAINYQRVGEVIAAYPNLGWGSGALLGLLCVAYLPNAAAATLAVLLGGSFGYGGASISLFDALSVPQPPLPIFAAVPPAVPAWAPVLMLVPAAIAVRYAMSQSFSLIDATLTASWAAICGVLLSVYAFGVVGAYGEVGTNPLVLAGLLFAWVFAVGLAAWVVSLVRD